MVVPMTASRVRLGGLITHVSASSPPGDLLDQVDSACRQAAHLNEVADHLIGHFVDQARAAGYTWTQIGEHIGVTKQAARKRFAPRDIPDQAGAVTTVLRERAREKVFGRYTAHARNAVAAAQDAARQQESPVIHPEHLLLGVCLETRGTGARVIDACGVSLDDLHGAVAAALAPAAQRVRGHIPFAEEGRKVLEVAARQSLLLDHDHIGTEHLLLSLAAQDAGTAARTLHALGITHERAQTQLQLLNGA